MTGHLLYTEEDVRLAARAFREADSATEVIPYEDFARAVLNALSSAGRLLPPGSETRERFGVRWPAEHRVGTGTTPYETWGYETGEIAVEYATAYPDEPDGEVLQRRVIKTPPTPWSPSVPDTKEETA